MIIITKNHQREPKGYSVFKPMYWATPFFQQHYGSRRYWRAKLLMKLWGGYGIFWTYGRGWIE